MKKVLFRLCCCIVAFFSHAAFAQVSPVYVCDSERKILEDIKNHRSFDTLGLFYYMHASDSATFVGLKHSFNEWYAFLGKELRYQNTYKKLKLIYVESEQRFFVDFNMHSNFHSLLSKGNFNHLTGSTYYAMVMHHFGIPYRILEYPTHIDVQGKYEKKWYAFEITDKEAGYWTMSSDARRAMVTLFTKDGLIGAQESLKLPTDTLYNRIMYKSNGITLLELAGLHYIEAAWRCMIVGKYDSAYLLCLKAEILYPGNKIRYIKSNLVRAMISEYGKTKRDEQFTVFAAFDCYRLIKDEILYDLTSGYLYDLILRDGNIAKAEQTLKRAESSDLSPALKIRIKHIYAIHAAHYFAIQKEACKAQESACVAYDLLPESPMSREVMDYYFRAGLREKTCLPGFQIALLRSLDSATRDYVKTYDLSFSLGSRVFREAGTMPAMNHEEEFALFSTAFDLGLLEHADSTSLASILADHAEHFYNIKNYNKSKQLIQFAIKQGWTNERIFYLEVKLRTKK